MNSTFFCGFISNPPPFTCGFLKPEADMEDSTFTPPFTFTVNSVENPAPEEPHNTDISSSVVVADDKGVENGAVILLKNTTL